MKIKGKISILIGSDRTTIKLFDEDAYVTFASVTLTPEQLSEALSRLANTECELELKGLDKLGKKMEHKQFVFEVPGQQSSWQLRNFEELTGVAQSILDNENEGWICEGYFGARDSFFEKDGKKYARCIVRRWVNK